MMNNIDLSKFKRLSKQSAQSFHQQKKLITKLMRGEAVKCEVCQQNIAIIPASKDQPLKLQCEKKCTDLELDIVI